MTSRDCIGQQHIVILLEPEIVGGSCQPWQTISSLVCLSLPDICFTSAGIWAPLPLLVMAWASFKGQHDLHTLEHIGILPKPESIGGSHQQ
jgi:hypothetical protein